jgi:lipooligosaccharide transport system permease protein
MRWLTSAFDWQSRAVMRRHFRLYMGDWQIKVLPPALEPLTMLIAFGFGLGAYMSSLEWQHREVSYLSFVAPGMLAYTAFVTPFFQTLYAAFIRMHYQRTWEGQLTTQIELRHVVWGEVLWAGLLAMIYAAIVAIVLAAFHAAGLVQLRVAWLPALLPISFVAACAFGALGLVFTATLPTIDHMNLPVFLLVLPMGMLSSTYFPLEGPVLTAICLANPLHHLAQAFRGVLIGGPVVGPLVGVAACSAVMLGVLVPLDLRLLRRRVLGD